MIAKLKAIPAALKAAAKEFMRVLSTNGGGGPGSPK